MSDTDTLKTWRFFLQASLANVPFVSQFYALETIDSTNRLARELAQQGAPQGTLVIAQEQTAGRGRLGRAWVSAAGKGLWFSFILRPNGISETIGLLPLVPAIVFVKVLYQLFQLAIGVKWPNDMVAFGKKLAGVLCEAEFSQQKVNHVVIGIGLNVWQQPEDFPSNLRDQATALIQLTSKKIDAAKLLAEFFRVFSFYYQEFESGHYDFLIRCWKNDCVHLQKRISIRSGNQVYRGIFIDLDLNGAAVIETEKGLTVAVAAGDSTILES